MRTKPPSGGYHESFQRPEPKGPSSRSFGLTFAGLFVVIGLLPLVHGGDIRLWALALAGGLGVTGLLLPALLDIPNRLWLRLGRVINRFVGPLVLGLFFYGVMTPIAAVLRRAGRDPLRRRRPDHAESYFIDRSASESSSGSLRNPY